MSTRLTHLNALDGLRALAIILVVLYHCTPNHNSDLGMQSLLFKIADIGWSGVDLFFVLSGYLITRILISYQRQGVELAVFYKKRLLRIVPLYLLAVSFVLIVAPIFIDAPWPGLQTYAGYFLYLSNIVPVETGFNNYFLLGHFWSLAVEMQFYLLFPFIVMYAREHLTQVLVLIIVLAMLLRTMMILQGVDAATIFSFTPYRIDGLLLGALAAAAGQGLSRDNKLIFNLVLAVVTLYLFYVTWNHLSTSVHKNEELYQLHRIFIPIAINLFYFQLLLLALSPGIVAVVLSNALFSFLAKYSYGIYVYHFLFYPLIERLCYPVLSAQFGSGNFTAGLFFLLALGIATALAYLSYHLYEKHFLKLKNKL